MVKVTLSNIINSAGGLRKLVTEPLPAKIAYRIKRIMDAVTSESARVEKVRVELITKYADEQTPEQKEKNEPVRVTKKLKEFQEEPYYFAHPSQTFVLHQLFLFGHHTLKQD